MKVPYGLEVIENCFECKLRRGSLFCNFSEEVLKDFSALSHPSTYPGSAILFVEGQQARGAFVLCSGKVKLSTTSREGKVLILKIAGPSEVLGLSAVLSGVPYEVTAATAAPCRVNFIRGDLLGGFLRRHGEAGLRAAQSVSKEYQDACQDIQEILMAPSSTGKLAKLLLSWANGRTNGDREVRVRSVLTHEEMAQMIGSSRETVTRVLSELKKKQLISLEGSILVIRDLPRLEQLAS
jgi:CRP/FNR family transcriptional regulator, cyclic AMP receptor protein